MLRTDIWAATFVRRHNDLGHLCVVSRRGDPVAGQIFLELDHLDGTVSLYAPAPMAARRDDGADRVFQMRFHAVAPDKVRERLQQEQRFDPDFWLISLEMRGDDIGVEVVP